MNIKKLSLLIVALMLSTAHIDAAQPETKTQTAARWGKGLGYGIVGTGAAAGSLLGIALAGLGITEKKDPRNGLVCIFGGLSLAASMPLFAAEFFPKCSEKFTDAEKKTAYTLASATTAITSALSALSFFHVAKLARQPEHQLRLATIGALLTALSTWYGKQTYDILKKAQPTSKKIKTTP